MAKRKKEDGASSKKTSTGSADRKVFTQATLVDGKVYAPGEEIPKGKQTKSVISEAEPEAEPEVVDSVADEAEPEAE